MNLQYPDCHSLDQLPWFEHNSEGRLVLSDPAAVGSIIDFHAHLGFALFFSPPLDLTRDTGETLTNFPMSGVPVDLSLESGLNLETHKPGHVVRQYMRSMVTNRGDHATHTVPNLLRDMADMNVEQSIVMAIDFPMGAQNSGAYLRAMHGQPALTPYIAINPLKPGWEARMDRLVAAGARGLKIHPYSEFMTSDHPLIIRMLRRWARTGLPVQFHTAFNAIAPGFLQILARMETYEKALRTFPDITFILGHAGMDFFEKAMDYANTYPNVYLEIDGQPPANLARIFDAVDHSRILFGSDWPFFPLALPLAKVLIATDGDRALRHKVLYSNASALLAQFGGARTPAGQSC
jgi:hypothetical protein